MRRQNSPTYIVGLMLFIASCSSPRYTYNFDYYDYNSGRKELPNSHVNESLLANKTEPLKLDRNQLVAAADPDNVKHSHPSSSVLEDASTATKAYEELSRSEKKHLRNKLKDYIKNHSKKLKAGDNIWCHWNHVRDTGRNKYSLLGNRSNWTYCWPGILYPMDLHTVRAVLEDERNKKGCRQDSLSKM